MTTLFLWIFEMLAAVLSFSAGIAICVAIVFVTLALTPSHAASCKIEMRVAGL